MNKTNIYKQKNISEFAQTKQYQKLLAKRHFFEAVFKYIGLTAIIFSILFLASLIINITLKSTGAFSATYVEMPIYLDKKIIKEDNQEYLKKFSYRQLLIHNIDLYFQEAKESRRAKLKVLHFFSKDSYKDLQNYVLKNPDKIGQKVYIWLKTSSKVDQFYKNNTKNLNILYKEILNRYFLPNNAIKKKLSFNLFTNGDSTDPEIAGIATSLLGSIFTIVIFLLLSFPLGVLLALYLEEFAPKNKFADFIEININNIAAIPSIIFGLLGLAIFINLLHIPRSSSLIGGLTLSLMVLPTIVIATRNSIKSVPANIKHAALGMGASHIQVALHHTLPLALPGILTGTILAVARALGETAPLIMIGMIAFIIDPPANFTDPTTVLPVQIYLWSNNPEVGFVEKTSATILLLLLFLVAFNSIAIWLRNKFTRKW